MIIHSVECKTRDGRRRLSAVVELEGRKASFPKTRSAAQELWFDWPEDYLSLETAKADPFVLVCFPLAMRLGERLKVEGAVSQDLILNVLEAMSIYHSYFPTYASPVGIEANGEYRVKSSSKRVGSFYSGGVDSLYNIAELKRLGAVHGALPVTDLWLVQGMDIGLDQIGLWEETKSKIFDQISADDGLRYADIRTNARDIHERYVNWTKIGFSVILGAIAKCFSDDIPTALIGSYAKYEDIIPHASSPLVDPMWSCDQQQVRHFSCRVNRQEKINTVGEVTPHLLAGLRVCYENPDEAYNCGTCEKCMRTQAQLLLGGHLGKARSFQHTLNAEALLKLNLPWKRGNEYTWDFWRDIAKSFREAGEIEFALALDEAFKRSRRKRSIMRITRWGK